MHWLATAFDWFSQLVEPAKLQALVAAHQHAIYAILFAVVFCETGLVVTPILPGDSMLFAAGAVAGLGKLNPWGLIGVLSAAAILGDTVNYGVGHYIGPHAFTGRYRFLKKEYLDRTHGFFERFGGLTIIVARFVPIVRTFAPFVAGIGAMSYPRFLLYNVAGGVAWVTSFSMAGYFFGGLEIVQRNFHLVIALIVVISVLPMVIEYLRVKGFAGSRR